MKKKPAIIILIVIFFVVSISGVNRAVAHRQASDSVKVRSRYTVVIDAGHGGKDAGTIGCDGTKEKDINLAIALLLYDVLRVSGISCVLIRNADYELYPEGSDRNRSDLYNRLDFVNGVENAVLISLHQNHFEDEREKGTQIWYAKPSLSKLLADSILQNIKQYLQPDNQRENKPTDNNYYILYNAVAPSIMVECGFMSNREENEKLQDREYQKDIVFLILTGICEEV